MSATLPKGIESTPAARRYEVTTHPSNIVFTLNSSPMEGKATLTEEPTKGEKKAGIAAIAKVTVLFFIKNHPKRKLQFLETLTL